MAERSHSPVDGATGEACNPATTQADATNSETRLKHEPATEEPTIFHPIQSTQTHRAVSSPNSSRQDKALEIIDKLTGMVQQREENESRRVAEKNKRIQELESEMQEIRDRLEDSKIIQQQHVQFKEKKDDERKILSLTQLNLVKQQQEAEKQTLLESQLKLGQRKVEKPDLEIETHVARDQMCQQDDMWSELKMKDEIILQLNAKLQEQKQQTLIYQVALFIVIFACLVYFI